MASKAILTALLLTTKKQPLFPSLWLLTKLSVNKNCLSLLFPKKIMKCHKPSSILVCQILIPAPLNYNWRFHSLSIFGIQPVASAPPDISPIGGSISQKQNTHVRLSSINPNRIQFATLYTTLQFSLDMDINIQCHSEINLDTQQRTVWNQLNTGVHQVDPKVKSTWSSSQVPAVKSFKPGGTAIITYNFLASKVKTIGFNSMGWWCYQIIDGKSGIELLWWLASIKVVTTKTPTMA